MIKNNWKFIRVDGELHHFLFIQAVSKDETFNEILRRLFEKAGITIPVENIEKVKKPT
jgi:negative regulator of replication initiation